MNDLERDIREAFDAVEMPVGLKEHTMAAVDARLAEKASADKPAMESVTESTTDSASACPVIDVGFPVDEAESPQTRVVAPSGKRKAARTRTSNMPLFRRLGFALAACLALAAIGFGGFKVYTTETAYIGIDINPSIELGINCFDRVVSERAVNDDGEKVLQGVSLVGKTYDEAMAALSDDDSFMTYVSENGFVEISVTSDNVDQTDKLTRESNSYIDSWPCEGSCHSVSSAERQEAMNAGMGVNRYRAAVELMSLDPTVTLEDCRAMSMRELRDRIVAAGGSYDLETGHSHEGSGEGHGQGSGMGMGNGEGQGSGNGNGQGQGQGSGNGQGSGTGSGEGQSSGDGQGDGSATGNGQGSGMGMGSGSGHNQGSGMGMGRNSGNG